MKKSLVALAALAATTAFAQSSVTLSGRASMDVSTFEAKGATAGAANDIQNRVRVADTSSRITFAANEDLGGGMKAGVYCETGINIDNAGTTGQADTANANTTTFCSREGRAFVGNATGEIRLGRQNVWWTQGNLNEVGANLLGSDTLTNLINGGVGVYTVRGENQVKLVGGSAMGAFAGSEVYWGYMGASGNAAAAATISGEAAAAGGATNSKYNGFKLNYTQGKLFAMVDYQNSTRGNTAANLLTGWAATDAIDRSATKYGVGYHYAQGSKVSLQYWNKNGQSVAAGAAKFKDSGYGITLNHDIGSNRLLVAQWGKANNVNSSTAGDIADTGATAYTLGGIQRMSKRTHVYVSYHKITNAAAANYNMVGGNYASGNFAAGTLGADVKMMAVGLQHNF